METNIRLNAIELNGAELRIGVSKDDGTTETLVLAMTDFILLTLRIQDLVQAKKTQSSEKTAGAQPLQAIIPQQLTVTANALSGDPVLIFGLGGLGDLPIEIPNSHLPEVLKRLLPFLSQAAPPATN